MIRTAIIENGIATNIVMHDPDGNWTPPNGSALVASETASTGDMWDGVALASPPPTVEQTNAPSVPNWPKSMRKVCAP